MGQVMMTDEQIKNVKNWVFALRSGYYEQGKNMLMTRDNRFCCLGVATQVLGIVLHKQVKDVSNYPGYEDEHGGICTTALGVTEKKKFALDIDVTEEEWEYLFPEDAYPNSGKIMLDRQGALIALNDKGKTFNEIADAIEEFGWDGSKQVEEEKATEPYREMITV